MVEKQLRNEDGFTLVQTLATFILITLFGMGLIMFSFQVSEQITSTQTITQTKNQKNYVTQEAKLTLDSELDNFFSEDNLKNNPLGQSSTVLENLMKQFTKEHQVLNEGKIGRKSGVTYKNELGNHSIERLNAVYPGGDDEQGWVSHPDGKEGSRYFHYRVTLPIKSTIMDKSGERNVMSDYCYEIQWESKSDGDFITEADIWGNIYYQINRPGGILPLSADTVMRKMSKIYHFQDTTPNYLIEFPQADLAGKAINGSYGLKESYIVDMKDGRQSLDHEVNHLSTEGSLILENGFHLTGANTNPTLITKNLLALTDQKSYGTKNIIENLSLDARTGLYLSFDSEGKDGKQIIIKNDANKLIETSNLVINQTINSRDESVGTFIESGDIHISRMTNDVTDFRKYVGNSNTANLQKNNWDQYQAGNFIVSNSKLEIGNNKFRSNGASVVVDNHFILTNAGMAADLSEESFSYFEDRAKEKIKTPSELTLIGEDTVLRVNGYSFFDAPKRYQRPLRGDKGNQEQLYVKNQGLNKVLLKEQSQMELGFTGVEAFELTSEKNTLFFMKVLPDLALFNSYFLEKGYDQDLLKGKVVLETYNSDDKDALIKDFQKKEIPYKVVTEPGANYSRCDNGVVTIIDNHGNKNERHYEFVTRYFSYLTDITY